mmetsp:Transcript_1820/g.4050  ORF Transcript_1820/g.4050 Transcript_1820/m.4050 type:complete len:209 (+) Transcript_1820:27-653(+)
MKFIEYNKVATVASTSYNLSHPSTPEELVHTSPATSSFSTIHGRQGTRRVAVGRHRSSPNRVILSVAVQFILVLCIINVPLPICKLGLAQRKVSRHRKKRIRSSLMLRSNTRTSQIIRQSLQSPKMAVTQTRHILDIINCGKVQPERLKKRLLIHRQVLRSQHFQEVGIIIPRVERYPSYSIIQHQSTNHQQLPKVKRINPPRGMILK